MQFVSTCLEMCIFRIPILMVRSARSRHQVGWGCRCFACSLRHIIVLCGGVKIVGAVSLLAGSTSTTGSIDGLATNARFSTPQSLGADSMGNLFIGERSNYAIRKIGIDG